MDEMPRPDDASADATPSGVRAVDLRDYVQFHRGTATRVRVLATDRLGCDLWAIEPGASTGVLLDPDADLVYTVLGGHSWFVTEDGEIGLDPLGAILVPAGTNHGIDNRAIDPLIVQVAVSPPGDLTVDEPAADATGAAIREEKTPRSRRSGGVGATFRRIIGGE